VKARKDPVIGTCRFTDGVERDVYQASDGRQFVIDDFGLPVFGVWLPPADNDADASLEVATPT
jgi:hypothetical protein